MPRTGQEIDAYYKPISIWSSKGYFTGSMITPLSDPRQITIIIQCGYGIIQTSFGLLSYIPGDLIQIPPHTPFCVYVEKCIPFNCKSNMIYSHYIILFIMCNVFIKTFT